MAYQLIRGNEEREINGTLAQKISSCLAALDTLLTQNSAIVASHVVPNKRQQTVDSKSQSLTDIVAEIMGTNIFYKHNVHLQYSYVLNIRIYLCVYIF